MERTDISGSADAQSPEPQPQAEPAAPPDRFRFSTREIPAEGKFETWRDFWMRRIVEVEVSTDSPASFEGDLDLWIAGPVSIAHLDASRAKYERTPSFARNGNNTFSLSLGGRNARGEVSSPKAGTALFQPGSGMFLDHQQAFAVDPMQDYQAWVLSIERNALLELLPRNFECAMQVFAPGSTPVLELIRSYVPLLTGMLDPVPPPAREMLGRHIVDLIALLMRPSSQAVELIQGRGLKAARTNALLAMLDRHFLRPDISADAIGQLLGISARQVHRLLEETPKTFNEHLLERRLQHAYGLLTRPSKAPMSIASIAKASGFADVTHFNRLFRVRFGDTPTGVRAAVAAERLLVVPRQT